MTVDFKFSNFKVEYIFLVSGCMTLENSETKLQSAT